MPEQRPDGINVLPQTTAAEAITYDAVEHGTPEGGLEVGVLAVEAGPEGGRRRKGLGIGAWLAIGWMVFIVAVAVLAKTGIYTWGSTTDSFAACARKGPFADEGSAHGFLLGCDSNGRDMIPRLALGAWESLLVATGAITVGFLVGGSLGVIAGYFSGRVNRLFAAIAGAFVGIIFGLVVGGVVFAVAIGLSDGLAAVLGALVGAAVGAVRGHYVGDVDSLLTGIFNVLLSVPGVVMALALVAFLQGSADQAAKSGLPAELILIIAIGVVAIPLVGRIARASALSWSQREFVLAARAQGAKDGRIMVREVLPNVAPAMFSISLLGIAVAIVAEGTLSILGVGVKPPTPSWGNIIALDRGLLLQGGPHIVFESSILIFLTVLALNFLGDVVRSRFDVREAGI